MLTYHIWTGWTMINIFTINVLLSMRLIYSNEVISICHRFMWSMNDHPISISILDEKLESKQTTKVNATFPFHPNQFGFRVTEKCKVESDPIGSARSITALQMSIYMCMCVCVCVALPIRKQ